MERALNERKAAREINAVNLERAVPLKQEKQEKVERVKSRIALTSFMIIQAMMTMVNADIPTVIILTNTTTITVMNIFLTNLDLTQEMRKHKTRCLI